MDNATLKKKLKKASNARRGESRRELVDRDPRLFATPGLSVGWPCTKGLLRPDDANAIGVAAVIGLERAGKASPETAIRKKERHYMPCCKIFAIPLALLVRFWPSSGGAPRNLTYFAAPAP
jgi:hypothetical protein